MLVRHMQLVQLTQCQCITATVSFPDLQYWTVSSMHIQRGIAREVSGRQRVDTLGGGAVSSWEVLLLSVHMVALIQLVNLVPSGLIDTKMVRCNDQTLPFMSVYLTSLQGFSPSVFTYWKRSNTRGDDGLGTITGVLLGIIPPILFSRHSCRSHSHQRLQRTRAKQK